MFGRSLAAGYMRRCLLHIVCPPESPPAAVTLRALPCSHRSPVASRTAEVGGSLRVPSLLWRLSPLCYLPNVMTSLCGPFVAKPSSGGGTHVPFDLAADIVAY